MNKKSRARSFPLPLAIFTSRSVRQSVGPAVVALLSALLVLWAPRARAVGFSDGFETYNLGALDSTDVGGPNEDVPGGNNPWFGSAPPNFRVVNAENGVTPHSGTNMVRGCFNCLYDQDVDWFNLSYRCATGGVYTADIALEWWFYDPLGSLGGGDYIDFVALGNYSPVPPDTDYSDAGWPAVASQKLCLGADAPRLNTNIDTTVYQARIVGATDGVNPEGWFNLTNAPRSEGWHHARVVIGTPGGTNTPASFYIDDMVNPVLVHSTVNTDGFNILELDGDWGNTSGYFDDFLFQDNATAPTFTSGPTNLTVAAGAAASFSVTGASGSPTPAYYWQKDGSPLSDGGRISGSHTATLTVTGTVGTDAGVYSCLVSNLAGVAVGNAALTVIVPPTIDSQNPAGGGFSAGSGGTVNLSVAAHATHTINYQWKKNAGNLSNVGHVSGATTSILTLTGIDATDVGTYTCHLSNADGSTDSAAVVLSLSAGPTISVQPSNQVIALTSNANFSVTAAGSGLAYQWKKGASSLSNGGRISGATSSALTISGVLDSDAGTYSCMITNTGGGTNSSAVTLTVIDPPNITTQPVSQVASNGSTVMFHVVATGGSLSYQWKKNASALSNGGDFSGVTTPDLTVQVSTLVDVGIYSVTVSNIAGTMTSLGAALRLNQATTNFFDDFETYSISDPIGYGRANGTALDYNYGDNDPSVDPWWGASPPNFCTYTSGQDGVNAYSGNQMAGGAFSTVSNSGDNDESFVNIAYRFNNGQIYYGDIMLDWYFYDPGTADAGDQLTLANFAARVPAGSDSSGFQIPSAPVQNLFLGTWPNLDSTKYQAGMMGATDGAADRLSKNISGTTKYFNTTATRSQGWHHARIVVGPADPGTHAANVMYFVDSMSSIAFSHMLQNTNVGFNAIHMLACSIFAPQTTETAGFFDDLSFQAFNDPYIVQDPVSLTNNAGTTANFTVVAMGTSYQWYKGNALIAGATNATLTLNLVSAADQAAYKCTVTGANGTLTSAPATLTVIGSLPVLTATPIGSDVVITWSGPYVLLSATNVSGPFSVVPGATSPYTNSAPLPARRFFGLGTNGP